MFSVPRNATLIVGLLLVVSANAQERGRSETPLEEVVVTAQKRAENVQEIPLAVQAVGQEELEAANVHTLVELPRIASSVTMQDNAYVLPYIRGIGSTNSGTGIYSSVAVYQDGVYLPRLTSSVADLDAEQIQILKGPQGALYGRNATGGAILITTRSPKPGDPVSINLEVGAGNFDRRDFRGSIYAGLSETVAASISGSAHKRDGYIKNLGGVQDDDGWSDDSYSINAKLVFEPIEQLHLKLGASFSKQDAINVLYQQLALDDAPGFFAPFGVNESLNGGQTLAASLLFGVSLPALGLDPANPADLPAVQGLANTVVGLTQGMRFSRAHGASYDNQIGGWHNGLLSGGKPNGAYRNVENKLFTLDARYNFEHFDLVSITSYGEHDLYGSTEVLNADPATADFSALGLPGVNIGLSANDFSESFSEDLLLVSTNSRVNWLLGVYYFGSSGKSVGRFV